MAFKMVIKGTYRNEAGYEIRLDPSVRIWTGWDPERFAFGKARTLAEVVEQAEDWEQDGRIPA